MTTLSSVSACSEYLSKLRVYKRRWVAAPDRCRRGLVADDRCPGASTSTKFKASNAAVGVTVSDFALARVFRFPMEEATAGEPQACFMMVCCLEGVEDPIKS